MSERPLNPNEHLDALENAIGARHALTLHRGFATPRTWEGGYVVTREVNDGLNSEGKAAHRDLVRLIVLSRQPDGSFISMPGAGPGGYHCEVDGVFKTEDVTLREINRGGTGTTP